MPREQCVSLAESPEVKTCTFGSESSTVSIVLFGDSHAIQWFNPLRRMAELHQWKLITVVKSGCPATDIIPPGPSGGCSEWRAAAIRRIVALRPSLVFIANSTTYIGRRGLKMSSRSEILSLTQWQDGTKRTLEALTTAGLRLAVMRDNPLSPFDIPTCLARTLRHSWYPGGSCEMNMTTSLKPAVFEAEKISARGLPNIHFIDLTDQFCQGEVCWAMRAGAVMYRDDNHLTGSFAASLRPALEAQLLPLLSPVSISNLR
jgi:hypothetical protein